MIKISISKVSRRIKNLREEKKLTQEKLAEQLGISRQSIISVERGKCLPSLPLALRIAETFKKSLEELFLEKGGETNMPHHLMPWSPFGDLDQFFEDDDWPMRSTYPTRSTHRGWQFPAVNIRQTDKDVTLTANIPGIKEENISIEVGNDFVDIAGERKAEKEEREEDYYRKEISYGTFTRRIPLPTEVKADKAEATIKDGQLKIVIPKLSPEKPKVTKIKVKKA